MLSDIYFQEWSCVSLSVVLLGLYHVYLWHRIKNQPKQTTTGMTNIMRRAWIRKIVAEGPSILGVQTLRNWTMASSFLASTAIVLAVGILGTLFTVRELDVLLAKLPLTDGMPEWWMLKLLVLSLNFFACFFYFSLAVRFYNHVAFLIHLRSDDDEDFDDEFVVRRLLLGARNYTRGMRCFYFAPLLSLWVFSPLYLLVGTPLMIVALYRLDHTV